MDDQGGPDPIDVGEDVRATEALVQELRAASIKGEVPSKLGPAVTSLLTQLNRRVAEVGGVAPQPAERLAPAGERRVDRRRHPRTHAAEALLGRYGREWHQSRIVGAITATISAGCGAIAILFAVSPPTSFAQTAASTEPSVTSSPVVPAYPPDAWSARALPGPAAEQTAPAVVIAESPTAEVVVHSEVDGMTPLVAGFGAFVIAVGSALSFRRAHKRLQDGIADAVDSAYTLINESNMQDDAEFRARRAARAADRLAQLRDWLLDEWTSAGQFGNRAQQQDRGELPPPELGLPS